MGKKINIALEEKVVKPTDPEAHKIHSSKTASQSSINKSESSRTKSSPKKIY